MKLSKHHTARSLAELHAHLGDAVAALRLAAMLRDDKGQPTLTKQGQDELRRHESKLVRAMFALEVPFMRKVGPDAPYASPGRPRVWLDWLGAAAAGQGPGGRGGSETFADDP